MLRAFRIRFSWGTALGVILLSSIALAGTRAASAEVSFISKIYDVERSVAKFGFQQSSSQDRKSVV